MEFTYQYDYIFTVIQKIVVFGNFCVIDFVLNIFVVWGNHENILPQNLFTYVKKVED